jgi:beta-lactamase class A
MTRVMDGVVRRSWVQPTPLRVPEVRVPRDIPAAPKFRAVSGLDGLRRTPPTLIESIVEPRTGSRRATNLFTWQRSSIAFGLVATALVVSSFTAIMLNHADGPTASAESVGRSVKTPSSTPPPVAVAAHAAAVAPAPQQALQAIVNTFAAGQETNFGIIAKDLKTGEIATLNPDRSEESASLYKLFVAQQIFSKIDSGALSYTQAAGGGTGANINDCLTIMINISDNGCGLALGDIVGWGASNPALKAAGYTGTDLATPQQTNPRDVARLMESIYRGSLNSPASNAHFLSLLKDQRVNNRLPLGLPSSTVIAHKTGDLDGFIHDAGIVYGPKTDYLVVMMGSPTTNYSQFVDLSAKLWAHFEN